MKFPSRSPSVFVANDSCLCHKHGRISGALLHAPHHPEELCGASLDAAQYPEELCTIESWSHSGTLLIGMMYSHIYTDVE